MSLLRRLQDRLAEGLVRVAARRLRRRYPEWADAMASEQASLAGHKDSLRWALGSWVASVRLTASQDALYPALLPLSVAAMALYQWSADEGLMTLLIVSLLGLCLGCISPKRALVSGVYVGVVVAAVNGFETLSGVRPAYEVNAHSLLHDLCWLVFVPPALASAALGRAVACMLPSGSGYRPW